MNLSLPSIKGAGALRRDVVRKVRQVGILETLKHGSLKLVRELRGHSSQWRAGKLDAFDLKYGTDTAKMVSVGALDIPDHELEHANRYEAVVPEAFMSMMCELPIAYEEFVFIDLGAGKGRALLLASLFPFSEIVGVEISPALSKIAINNVSEFKDEMQQCHAIRVVSDDAASFEFPHAKLVVFLYDPFGDHVMGRVVTNLGDSIRNFQREVFVVYQRPAPRTPWDESETFRIIKHTPTFAIYQSAS